jgi:hypothetical protein
LKKLIEQNKQDQEKLHHVPVANRLMCQGHKSVSNTYRNNFDSIKWRTDPKVKYSTVKRPRAFVDRGLNVVDPMTGEVLDTL